MIQTKKSLNFSILPVKIYIHLKCYIVGLEIEAAIQKDGKWGISHSKRIESCNILT